MGDNKVRLKVEVAVVCMLIAATWILLSLPILFYHIPISEVRPVFICVAWGGGGGGGGGREGVGVGVESGMVTKMSILLVQCSPLKIQI